MRVLSLFDGIACLRVALGDRKIDYYGSAEIDVNAIAVQMNNWDDITPLGDVCSVKGITDIDLLCGGSPCTDLSIAKSNREGLKGDRSKLFYEWVRIWKETKPRWFILENVASMADTDRNEISKQLGVQPIMIDAALVSAQSRKRLFWTNIPVKGLPENRNIRLKDILEPTVAETFFIGNHITRTLRKEVVSKPDGLTVLGHCGNSNSQGNRIYGTDAKSSTLSANGGGLGAKTGLYQVGFIGNNYQTNRVYSDDGKCPTITKGSSVGGHVPVKIEVGEIKRIRKLTPVECERLQGVPDNYTDCLSNTQRYRCLGNAFNVEVIKFILSFLPVGDKN